MTTAAQAGAAFPAAAPAVGLPAASGVDHEAPPFVGPRPYPIPIRNEQRLFGRDERPLFGRDRERLELLDLLIAERIVLLYSPSGAGKTSLVQAACVPALREEGFVVPAVARVTFDSKLAAEPANRYVFAVLLSLEEGRPDKQVPIADLAKLSLPEYLDNYWDPAVKGGGLVLILDQFEEVLTIDPTDVADKRAFFKQLGQALRNRKRWALLSMREEHVAGLDPYRNLVPTRLAATYRLDLLDDEQACQAMQGATRHAGVDFTDPAARKLVDDLRRVRIERPGRSAVDGLGPTVEPTQLQVVCLRLWASLAAGKTSIEVDDVKALGSADTALADYYADVVGQLGGRERFVRDWIGQELITANGLRNQVLREDALQAQRVNEAAIALLDRCYLIREERRRGVRWLELAHDRLVDPIRNDNLRWRDRHLMPFQRQAALWQKEGRPRHLELGGAVLGEAEKWAQANRKALTAVEWEFLERSQQRRRRRINRALTVVACLAFTFGALAYWKWLDNRPWAYWTHLGTAVPYALSDDMAPVGRMSEGSLKSQIDLRSDFVSRLHLMVTHRQEIDPQLDLVSRLRLMLTNRHKPQEIHDVRSQHGTTVNAKLLGYNKATTLQKDDLVVIGGVAPFHVSPIEFSYYRPLPPAPRVAPLPARTWGLFIDGPSKSVEPLVDDVYFVEHASGEKPPISDASVNRGKQHFSAANQVSIGSLLQISRPRKDWPQILALKAGEGAPLSAMLAYGGQIWVVQIPAGSDVAERLKVFAAAENVSKLSFCYGLILKSEGRSFDFAQTKIRSFSADDEPPECKLGPFQVVTLR